ncbi:SAM-dependent methyltransferase [Uliginosibacterium sp. H3]|uniref:SAM-dependent methyltransferase n=1 Tax=Uliginosibacterium silvisoli TaxID=3114758 RepID=A0ABU6JYG4_9RHOO|nr:SAM-dependent methyltransferase [Uliginosibacterium sp. H3]
MKELNQLPLPGADAQAHSDALLAQLRHSITAADGWISFARYMEEALYTPGLGYYSGGSRKFGADGDFITAPEISPLYGSALAAQVAQVMSLSARQLIEVGAGTGALAADLLTALEASDMLPERYDILELSGELRERQAQTLQARVPHLAARVRWLDALPASFEGCIVANEVLDVMPVHCLVWRNGECHERGVSLSDGQLVWAERELDARLATAVQALPVRIDGPDEYASEICLASRAWLAEWARSLQRGALLLIDYGYPQAEYYLPARSTGTLQCYYRHRAHTELLQWPGLNDITAFVDFTASAEAAYDAGLDVLGYTTQASFLVNCGVLQLLEKRGPSDGADYLRAARALQRLIGPHEMGELFKVLAVGKGIGEPLLGFTRGDRTHAL